MGMKKYFIFTLGLIAIISISCKLAVFQAENDAEKELIRPLAAGKASNSEHYSQEPDTNKMVKADEEDQKNHDQTPPPAPEQPPAKAPQSGDFSIIDENGVIITKKNGMQITKMPSGEVYYLPDEF